MPTPIVRPCPDALDCPPDGPLDNYSSEADDTLDFISTKYSYTPPILGNIWNKTECGVTFVSSVSQADADLQASAAAAQCPPCLGDGCGVTKIIQTFCNGPQTVCFPCPDGSLSCFDVPGGVFCGYSNQASADSAANNFALTQAIFNKVCVSFTTSCACIGISYSATLTATQPVTWSIVGGSLPPGLALTFTTGSLATISGIPTTYGQYTFRVKAQSFGGSYALRTITITVLAIVTTVLPPYAVGVPYSFQLQVLGGSGNYSWKIASGSLPNGLSMSITGLISGTPQ